MRLHKFLESTIDYLTQTAVSGLTKKYLDKRYENDFNIELGSASYYRSQDFLELVFYANSTYGSTDFIASTDLPQGNNRQYTLALRFYKVKEVLGDIQPNTPYSVLEPKIKNIIHQCDVKLYSDDSSFYFQGSWESLDKANLSIYKFPGPAGSGKWDAMHTASGDLANPPIHITKHLAQVCGSIDSYIPTIAQKLRIK